MGGSGLADLRTEISDLVQSHRRLLTTALIVIAAVGALSALRPAAGRTIPVWVAAHDLRGGAPLRAADLRLEELPVADVPAAAIPHTTAPVGRLLAAPMRRGEPLTDVRLLSAALLSLSGTGADVAVPVRVSDGPAALALLHPGDRVDVITTEDVASAGLRATAGPVVQDVGVLAIPAHVAADDAGLIIVAATPAQAASLAEIPAGDRVSIALRPSQ